MKPQPFEQFLSDLLRSLVVEFISYPKDLEIKPTRFNKIVSIAWRGNRADQGRMIGTNGDTFRPLASYMKLVGDRHGYDVELERVGEAVKGVFERYPKFNARADWPRTRLLALLERAVRAACTHDQVEITAADVGPERTAVQVNIALNENLSTQAILDSSMKHIFKVIGNANGRDITLKVDRTLKADTFQPATADGRYAKV